MFIIISLFQIKEQKHRYLEYGHTFWCAEHV